MSRADVLIKDNDRLRRRIEKLERVVHAAEAIVGAARAWTHCTNGHSYSATRDGQMVEGSYRNRCGQSWCSACKFHTLVAVFDEAQSESDSELKG